VGFFGIGSSADCAGSGSAEVVAGGGGGAEKLGSSLLAEAALTPGAAFVASTFVSEVGAVTDGASVGGGVGSTGGGSASAAVGDRTSMGPALAVVT
jgi:hypothetical protein